MDTKKLIVQEMEQAPDLLLKKVLNFLRFLKAKQSREKLGTTILSESSLQKEWLSREEDEAWQDL